MSSAVEDARTAWLLERARFEAFGLRLKARLETLVREVGVYAEVSARAKEVSSLVKKLLLKKHLTYETLPDKAGVRIIVRYLTDVPKVQAAVCNAFQFQAADDKTKGLALDRVGYHSVHIDHLAFRSEDVNHNEFPAERFYAELQLRTQAQHLWSEFTHDTVYKNDSTLVKMPDDLLRRINLMAGLIEVADREFDRMNHEMPTDKAIALFRDLEALYYRLGAHRPDVELSLEVIRLLLPLYGDETELQIMRDHIAKTYEQSEGMLRTVYSNPDYAAENVSAFFHQPEALLIYDRLLMDRDRTLTVWNRSFPPEELERVASVFGISLD